MANALDRMKKNLAGFIEAIVGRRLLYAYMYEATVITYDAGAGEAAVLADDTRVRGQGTDAVNAKVGIGGATIELRGGDRVVLAFSGGDPNKPFCFLVDQAIGSSTLAEISRIGDLIDGGTVVGTVTAAPGSVTFVYAPPGAPPHPPSTTLDLSNAILKGPEILTGSSRLQVED